MILEERYLKCWRKENLFQHMKIYLVLDDLITVLIIFIKLIRRQY